MSSAPDRHETDAIRAVTIAIPSWNGKQHLARCLPALRAQEDPGVRHTVVVHDNGSDDGTARWLEDSHPEVRLLRSDKNLGFAAACNRLAQATDADAIAFLNNDTHPEPGWLRSLVDALRDAPADVVAIAGLVVDWNAERLDFAGGILTFDGHAFQRGFGRRLSEVDMPPEGEELLFASGSNMIVRRRGFLELGGFDPHYFAYLEDVDFGWRAWAAGYRILFADRAVVRHRSAATSVRIGHARRGFLIERNAFMTAFKNYDAPTWGRFAAPIMATLAARATGCLAHGQRTNAWLGEKPRPEAPVVAAGGLLRRLGAALGLGGPTLRPDVRAEAHLRALAHVTRDLDRTRDRRLAVQKLRRRPDAEIFDRFPLYLVPTYPGDAALFTTATFRDLLGNDAPVVRATLDEVMERR